MKSTYALHRPVVNAYLVRERDRRRLRELLVVLALVVPIGLALLAYTWIHLEVLRAGYRIGGLEQRQRELTRAERQLRLEAAYLASPERVGKLAQERLGMREPALDQMVFAEELK